MLVELPRVQWATPSNLSNFFSEFFAMNTPGSPAASPIEMCRYPTVQSMPTTGCPGSEASAFPSMPNGAQVTAAANAAETPPRSCCEASRNCCGNLLSDMCCYPRNPLQAMLGPGPVWSNNNVQDVGSGLDATSCCEALSVIPEALCASLLCCLCPQ